MSIMKTRAQDINEKITWQEADHRRGRSTNRPLLCWSKQATGEWMMPVFKEDKCRHCLLCVPFCPDSSIPVKDGRTPRF